MRRGLTFTKHKHTMVDVVVVGTTQKNNRLHKCTHQNFTRQIITSHYVLLSSKLLAVSFLFCLLLLIFTFCFWVTFCFFTRSPRAPSSAGMEMAETFFLQPIWIYILVLIDYYVSNAVFYVNKQLSFVAPEKVEFSRFSFGRKQSGA